jgi:hypothetical protein
VCKRGNRDEEYEDAYWPPEATEGEETPIRVAVADGATESSFAQRWAQLLVQATGEGRLSLQDPRHGLLDLRSEWQQWIVAKELPWYAEAKARQGAFAALVALELAIGNESGGQWQAAAIGDSCLFHVRAQEVLSCIPVRDSADFDNRPFLLGTVPGDEDLLSDRIVVLTGTWLQGDDFYLMSDALACWALKCFETAGADKDALGAIATCCQDGFSYWIESLRDKGLMRNDDCTLVRVSIR